MQPIGSRNEASHTRQETTIATSAALSGTYIVSFHPRVDFTHFAHRLRGLAVAKGKYRVDEVQDADRDCNAGLAAPVPPCCATTDNVVSS